MIDRRQALDLARRTDHLEGRALDLLVRLEHVGDADLDRRPAPGHQRPVAGHGGLLDQPQIDLRPARGRHHGGAAARARRRAEALRQRAGQLALRDRLVIEPVAIARLGGIEIGDLKSFQMDLSEDSEGGVEIGDLKIINVGV